MVWTIRLPVYVVVLYEFTPVCCFIENVTGIPMSYVALYRKFRPQTFDQLKGQDHVVRALKNQLLTGRIGHAYLFTGTRGTGKTSAAKIFAKAVNCLHPVDGEPCNECENCKAVSAGNFVDVAEVDAASNNGVDDIRRIIEEVRYTPVKGKYKVFIIDEAHMITGSAFNAFLKTLEEPPAYAVFILATTEPHKLPITILSRCQRYDFRRITSEEIAGNLAYIIRREGIQAEDKALRYIARAGDGSMRDAISLLDKCIAFNLGEDLTYETVLDTLGTVDTEVFSRLFQCISAGDAAASLQIVDTAAASGRDLTQFASDLIWYIRNILMTKAAGITDPDVLGISEENMAQLRIDATGAESPVLMRYIRILSELVNQIRFSSEKQVLLEAGIIRLARPETETDTDSLADRIRHLEMQISSGQTAKPIAPPQTGTPAPYGPVSYESAGYSEPEPYVPEAFYSEPTVYEPAPYRGPEELEGRSAGPEPERKEELPSAEDARVPGPSGDLWQQIVASCENPRIRIVLGKCTAELTEGVHLKIAAPSIIALKQLKEESTLQAIRQLAQSAAGHEIDVQTVLKGTDTEPPKTQFPEEVLSHINFKIGTEEW